MYGGNTMKELIVPSSQPNRRSLIALSSRVINATSRADESISAMQITQDRNSKFCQLIFLCSNWPSEN